MKISERLESELQDAIGSPRCTTSATAFYLEMAFARSQKESSPLPLRNLWRTWQALRMYGTKQEISELYELAIEMAQEDEPSKEQSV